MNERIKDLYEQAGLVEILDEWASEYGNGMFENTPCPPLEKFAELIVRECARIGELKEQGYSEYDSNMSVGWYMKRHFGVEE